MAVSGITGNGTTITGAGIGGYTGKVMTMSGFNETLDSVEANDLSTTEHDNFLPGDLIHHSEITMTVVFDPLDQPTLGTVGTITITFPNSNTLAGTGFATGTGFDTIANNTRIEGTVVVRFDGDTGPAYASGA